MSVSESILESKENGLFIDEYLYDYAPISETDTLRVESEFSEYVHYYNANDNNYTLEKPPVVRQITIGGFFMAVQVNGGMFTLHLHK